MTREQRRRRDEQIAVERALGRSECDAAAKYGVDVRTVRRAYKRWKDGAFRLEAFDPVDEILDYLLRFEVAVSDLAQQRTHDDPLVQIAAMRAQVELWHCQIRLLMEVGVIPRVGAQTDAWRREHAAQINLWLRRKAHSDGGPAELGEGLANWVSEAIADYLERAPRGVWGENEDAYTHKDVRSSTPAPAETT